MYRWFKELLEVFRRQHKDYDPKKATPYIPPSIIGRLPKHVQGSLLTANEIARPDYICPKYRHSVHRCPSVLWQLKDLVKRVAAMQGVKDPYQPDGELHGKELVEKDWAELFGL